MFITATDAGGRLLLVISDASLQGQCFSEGQKQLDLTKQKGREATEEEINELIVQAFMVQAIGKESVAFCKEKGAEVIQTIQEIPFTFLMKG